MLGFTSGGGLSVGLSVFTRLAEVAPNDQFLVLVPAVAAYQRIATPPNAIKLVFDVSSSKRMKRFWIDHVRIPALCREFGADVLFSMSNFGPFRAPCPHVLGIHLGYLAYPVWPVWQRLSARDRLLLRVQALYFAVVIAHVDRVCALTATSAARLAVTLALASKRIVVVPNASAPDSRLDTPDDPHIRETMTRHPARLRLCYPALGYAHKNHEVLPEVLRVLHVKFGIDDVAIFVTVEPSDSSNAQRFLSAVDALGLRHQIVNLGHLDQSAVPTVYRYSHGLLMPTLLESASLSYLEALQCGVPILTSDYDFAREACADAALYFDPLDPSAIASVIARFARQPGTVRNLQLRAAERARLHCVSWNEVTRQYVAILHAACGSSESSREVSQALLPVPSGGRKKHNSKVM